MSLKQYKYKRIETPVGEAIYPWLHKPDTKYNDAGVFKVKLKFNLDEELEKFLEELNEENEAQYQKFVAEAKASGKRPPKKFEPNYYEDDDYGYLNVKCNATLKLKDTGEEVKKTLPILSEDGEKFEGVRYVNGGSKIKAVIDLVPMNSPVAGAGVSLRLICVKVKEFAPLPPKQDVVEAADEEDDQPF